MLPKPSRPLAFLETLSLLTGGLAALSEFFRRTDNAALCNTQEAFSLATPLTKPAFISIFALILVAVTVSILRRTRQLSWPESLGWLLFLSGGFANILERLHYGCILDPLPFIFGLTNNLADWFIAIGALLIVVYYGRKPELVFSPLCPPKSFPPPPSASTVNSSKSK